MRVTEALISQFIKQSNSAATKSFFSATQKVVTGKNIERPSEDLVTAQRILHLDGILTQLDHFKRAREIVHSDLQAADAVATTATAILISAKEAAVQMATDTVNADDRAAEAEAIKAMREQILDLANTQLSDGRHLFSGVAENTATFDNNGIYQGSQVKRTVEVIPGFFVEASTLGSELFGDPSVVEILDTFAAALQANDTVVIADMIGELDEAIKTMNLEHTSIGGRLKNVEEAEVLLEDLVLRTKIQRAEAEDIDLAEAITDMNNAEIALTAVVEASKRLLGASALRWLS